MDDEILCLRCVHFIALDIDDMVDCSLMGKTTPKKICRFFKDVKKVFGDGRQV